MSQMLYMPHVDDNYVRNNVDGNATTLANPSPSMSIARAKNATCLRRAPKVQITHFNGYLTFPTPMPPSLNSTTTYSKIPLTLNYVPKKMRL